MENPGTVKNITLQKLIDEANGVDKLPQLLSDIILLRLLDEEVSPSPGIDQSLLRQLEEILETKSPKD